jgi:hypothetical protein
MRLRVLRSGPQFACPYWKQLTAAICSDPMGQEWIEVLMENGKGAGNGIQVVQP